MSISLKDAIKSSYGNKKAKQKNLSQGYIKDKNLSSGNQKVFIAKIQTIYYSMLLVPENLCSLLGY